MKTKKAMKKEKKSKTLLIAVAALLPMLLTAQVKDTLSTSAKIDSIFNLQKKMYSESKNEPLHNKKYGVEINLFRLLLLDEAQTFSGSISLFNVNRNAEIAFPFYFQKPKKSVDLTEFTFDCHFRYFLGNTQNGFYISGFARYAFLHGTLGSNNPFSQSSNIAAEENKFGIGFGIGYRKFSYKGLYWGTSLSFGKYFIGENNKFYGDFLTIDDDNKYIFDWELLKFGWAF
jgi:hypothetical protein